jgi:hypothetical protein
MPIKLTMTFDVQGPDATLLAAARNALALLQNIQAQTEQDPDAMPWPEIDALELAIAEAEGL